MNKRPKNILGGAGFYAVLLLCLAAVGTGAYFLLFQGKSAPGSHEAVSAAAGLSAQSEQAVSSEVRASASAELPEKPPVPQHQQEDSEPVMTVDTAPSAPVAAEEPQLIVRPLNGKEVAAFSQDQLQYSETLDDWRTHDGIDISAAAGTKVLAASAGTVLEVTNDELMGTTVVLSHSGGYQTTYSNLQKKPLVSKGDTVSSGQVLGLVGETSLAEAAEGPHLHFSVAKNGDAVDPDDFLRR